MLNNTLSVDNAIQYLTPGDFETVFQDQLSDTVQEKIKSYGFAYTTLSLEEREEATLEILKTLFNPDIVQAGEHRLPQWEFGWGENLTLVDEDPTAEATIPRYYNKYNIARWRQQFIRPASEDFEYNMLKTITDWLFDRYMSSASAVYEFGCGTGHHLLRLRQYNPTAKLWGLDWATSSQAILERLNKEGVDTNLFGHRFDYFQPDESFHLAPDAVVYTVASLEQIGDRFEPFVNYLLKNKPQLCVHIEPIGELLDENTLIDFLSIEYFKKRNYLNGFLNHLQKLENQGKVVIHRAQRTFIGSFFIEGYSVIVWSPVTDGTSSL